MSTKTGVPPALWIVPAVAKNVNGVVMTSSPGRRFSALSGSSSASVPLAQPTPCFACDSRAISVSSGTAGLHLLSHIAGVGPGDEVLVPAPDYPLWTAAVILNGGRAVHYPCESTRGWQPDPDAIEARITPRTRALVIINPNNPTGAVYPRALLERLVQIAEKHRLVLFSDEIYDHVLYDGARFQPLAPLVENTLCVTLGGLSKVQRACGWRVGWMCLSGKLSAADAATIRSTRGRILTG